MRYVIIDYMHLLYKCMNVPPLWTHMSVNGEMQAVETTIPSITIKNIVRYSDNYNNPVIVCFEGGNSFRKNHFQKGVSLSNGDVKTAIYKDGRGKMSYAQRKGLELTEGLLQKGKVACARATGFEADDYIYTTVLNLKRSGVTDPIDIITGDRDMLPLVDNQVSVYMRSNREYNEDGCPNLAKYFQVTPRSWDVYCGYSSEYKGYAMPYNSVLLYKMLKGDASDGIPRAVNGYGGVKYTSLINQMTEGTVPFDRIFRYGEDFDEYISKILSIWFTPDEVAAAKFNYEGLNLREVPAALIDAEKGTTQTLVTPSFIQYGELQRVLLDFQINLAVPR